METGKSKVINMTGRDGVDELAISFACNGTRIRLTDRDRVEAVWRMVQAGVPVDDIAWRVGSDSPDEIRHLIAAERRRRARLARQAGPTTPAVAA